METNDSVFDRDKLERLMQRHTAEPTDQFVLEELERCKDPRYFYNNYWSVDGRAVKPLSEVEWKQREDYMNEQRYLLKPRYRMPEIRITPELEALYKNAKPRPRMRR